MALLGVDLGLTGGLARYSASGALEEVRSFSFASVGQLKRALPSLFTGEIEHVFLEGDKHLGDIWARWAEKRGARVHRVAPEVWRARVLLAREQRTGADAKEAAQRRAREVIASRAVKKPTTLRTDAAEAVLIGLYGLLAVGWANDLR